MQHRPHAAVRPTSTEVESGGVVGVVVVFVVVVLTLSHRRNTMQSVVAGQCPRG